MKRDYSVLTLDDARRQHEWLLGARARLLRVARVLRRQRCIELGAGWGFAAVELAERSGQRVTAIDRDESCVNYMQQQHAHCVHAIRAEVGKLPLPDGAFDLVFAQFAFLWFHDLALALDEVRRLLAAGGTLVAIEPDFGGMITWPDNVGLPEIWLRGLRAAGAEPLIGRKLAVALRMAGFETQIMLSDRLEPADAKVLDLLLDLPLDPVAHAAVKSLRQDTETSADMLCHLPLFMIVASVA